MHPFNFATTAQLICEPGSSRRLASLCLERGARSVLVVTDPGITRFGLLDDVLPGFEAEGLQVAVYNQVVADPPEDIVLAAVVQARAVKADLVIGFGGGSSMDVAKLVALLAHPQCSQSLQDIYGVGNARGQRLPLIQVPTTAGTGSEVTQIAIITTGETTKMGVVSTLLLPDLALLDADLTLGLQSSYDFTQEDRPNVSPWQLVGARTEWRPNENFEIRSVASYDPQRQVWSNLRFDLGWQSDEAFVSLGARYDGFRQQWGAVNAYFEGLKFGRLRATGVVNFNGYLKKIEAQQYLLTYDLHCAELVMQVIDNRVGFRPGREIYVFLRLKAIPYQPDFGVGRRGQPIGTGTGSGF